MVSNQDIEKLRKEQFKKKLTELHEQWKKNMIEESKRFFDEIFKEIDNIEKKRKK